MKQRSEEERVAELQAKIEAIKARGVRKKAKANPAVKHGTLALKSIDRAAAETADTTARKALEDARGALSGWLAIEGLTLPTSATATKPPAKRGYKRKNNTATATAS